jgi:hypothetical protein
MINYTKVVEFIISQVVDTLLALNGQIKY